MKLLGFVNWKALDAGFRWLMWLIAGVLAVIILMNAVPDRPSPQAGGAAAAAAATTQTTTPAP